MHALSLASRFLITLVVSAVLPLLLYGWFSLRGMREQIDEQVVLDAIADGVRKDEVVQLIGFGTFKVSHRAARMGRNPKTGEAMQINASKSVKFSPSAAFKKSL